MIVFYIDVLVSGSLELQLVIIPGRGSVINNCLCITLNSDIYKLFLHFNFYCDNDFLKITRYIEKKSIPMTALWCSTFS